VRSAGELEVVKKVRVVEHLFETELVLVLPFVKLEAIGTSVARGLYLDRYLIGLFCCREGTNNSCIYFIQSH